MLYDDRSDGRNVQRWLLPDKDPELLSPERSGQFLLDEVADERTERLWIETRRVGVGWLHVGKRHADIANNTRLGSYNVVNLWAAKQLDLHTDLFITVENLCDQDYAFWQGYPGRGRKVRAGVEYRF